MLRRLPRPIRLLGRHYWAVQWNAATVTLYVLEDIITRLERIRDRD